MVKNTKNIKEIGRIVFFLSLIFIIIFAILRLPRLAVPLGIAYILYLIINPILPNMMKLGLGRGLSVFVVFVGIFIFSAYPVAKVVPMIKTETENFQYYVPKIESYLTKTYKKISTKIKERTGLEIGDKVLINTLSYITTSSREILLNLPTVLATFLEWLIVIPFLLFFFLKDGRKFRFLFLRLAPNSFFERFYYLFHQFNKKIGDYIFAKFIEASIVGIIIISGLFFMEVRFSFLLGLVAGITNIIPYIGPFLGMIPAVILALVEYGVGPTFGGILVLYIIANALDLAIVFPVLVSKIVDLHPIIVVVSVILGSQYLGVPGMIISIPLAAALKLIYIEIFQGLYTTVYK